MKSLHASFVALATATALLVGCGSPPKKPEEPANVQIVADAGAEDSTPPAPATTFEKLGKREGLTGIVDSFLKNATADKRVKSLFAKWGGDRQEELKAVLVDHLCKGTGGDCTPPDAAGKPLKIDDAKFDALKEDLKVALDEKTVSDADQAELTKAFDGIREPLAIVLNQKK